MLYQETWTPVLCLSLNVYVALASHLNSQLCTWDSRNLRVKQNKMLNVSFLLHGAVGIKYIKILKNTEISKGPYSDICCCY